MNYNSKRLTNPLKPICKCRKAEFNALVDIIRGSTSTKEHNKNFAFRKAIEELTSPCTDKNDDSLTLAEIVKVIPYLANEEVSIECDVFNANAEVKPKGFFILVGEDNRIKSIESIYYYSDRYYRNSSNNNDQRIENICFPLTDKDITLIKDVLSFTGSAFDYTSDTTFKNRFYSGTIYIYQLNGTD
jgi:hypothetical protein